MKPEKAFGIVLRSLRNQKALSQEKLAFEANLARNFISFLERGLRQPTLATILGLAAALGVRPGQILDQVVETMKLPDGQDNSDFD